MSQGDHVLHQHDQGDGRVLRRLRRRRQWQPDAVELAAYQNSYEISGLRAVDDHALVVELLRPANDLVNILAMTFASATRPPTPGPVPEISPPRLGRQPGSATRGARFCSRCSRPTAYVAPATTAATAIRCSCTRRRTRTFGVRVRNAIAMPTINRWFDLANLWLDPLHWPTKEPGALALASRRPAAPDER